MSLVKSNSVASKKQATETEPAVLTKASSKALTKASSTVSTSGRKGKADEAEPAAPAPTKAASTVAAVTKSASTVSDGSKLKRKASEGDSSPKKKAARESRARKAPTRYEAPEDARMRRKRRPNKRGVFLVSKIVGKRGAGATTEYEVKWVGYAKTTWEPAASIEADVPEVVEEFTGGTLVTAAAKRKRSKSEDPTVKRAKKSKEPKAAKKASKTPKVSKKKTTTKTSTKKTSAKKATTKKAKKPAVARRIKPARAAAPAAAAATTTAPAKAAVPKAASAKPAHAPKAAELPVSRAGRRKPVSAKALKAHAVALKGGAAPKKTKKIIKRKKGGARKVDQKCTQENVHVYEDFDCALNQTNIEFNNNKYYIIQLLEDTDKNYFLWTHWGRVGADGQHQLIAQPNVGTAKIEFCKKFMAKTLNAWEERDRFMAHHRKYTLIATDNTEDGDDEEEEIEVEVDDETDGVTAAEAAATAAAGQKMLFAGKFIGGQLLYIIQCDLVDIEADAVVHPTSHTLSTGGQVGGALSNAGGQPFRDAMRGKSLDRNGVCITDAGLLPASYVVHVQSPHYDHTNPARSKKELSDVIHSALRIANEKGVESIAFPSIGSGVNAFPKDAAASTILTAIGEFFKAAHGKDLKLKEVYFILYDAGSMAAYTSSFQTITQGLNDALGRTASSVQKFV